MPSARGVEPLPICFSRLEARSPTQPECQLNTQCRGQPAASLWMDAPGTPDDSAASSPHARASPCPLQPTLQTSLERLWRPLERLRPGL